MKKSLEDLEKGLVALHNNVDVKTLQVDYTEDIGHGGMGTVYPVIDHDNIVAKVIPLDSDFDDIDINNPMMMDPKNPLTKEALIVGILKKTKNECPYVMRYYGYRIETKTSRKTKKDEEITCSFHGMV